MENATKALLIAAAVLVAILIISLGLGVYNMAAETMGNVNLSGQEIQAFNDQFAIYNGEHKRGSDVNALLKTVLTSNLKNKTEENTAMMVTVKVDGKTVLSKTATSIPTGVVDTSKLYTISVVYKGEGGLVNQIVVTKEK